MDFDIDSVLDQLEKTLNKSDHEEKSQLVNITPVSSDIQKSANDLLLFDLDPFACPNNGIETTKKVDENENFAKDLQELYATSTIIEPLPNPSNVLPDIANHVDESLTVSLPSAVNQLEIEVRQEILQHTLDQDMFKSEPFYLSDSIQDEEESDDKSTVVEHTGTVENVQDGTDLNVIQEETPTILHSVDSIVNATTLTDFEGPSLPMLSTIMDTQTDKTSLDLAFTECYDDVDDDDEDVHNQGDLTNTTSNNEEFFESSIDELKDNILETPAIHTTDASTQGFDLVKNVLSEILDKPEEEAATEENDTALTTAATYNDENFRFLDEMLASVNISDSDIHQLTAAEMERVDALLKEIVNSQQTEDVQTSCSGVPSALPSTLVTNHEDNQYSSIVVDRRATEDSLVPEQMEAAASAAPVDEELVRVEQEWARLTDEEKQLGSVAPEWVSDDQAPTCMKCSMKFSLTRRRHHCRACGKVFCSTCCWQKAKLIHDDSKEDRTCNDCIQIMARVEYLWNYMRNNQKPRTSVLRKKSETSTTNSTARNNSTGRTGGLEHKKSVTFHDSVKPGTDTNASAAGSLATDHIMSSDKILSNETVADQVSLYKSERLTEVELEEKLRQLKDPNEPPVEFRIHNNLTVISKIVDNFDCYLNRSQGYCWIFSTRGLSTIAQDELVYIFDVNLICANDIICDLLNHIYQIYIDATKGSFVRHLGLSLITKSSTLFSSSTLSGFVYVSDSTVSHNLFPDLPYLFGLIFHQSEYPIVHCFPIRLLLRLGYEYKSYPWPLFNTVNRNHMFNNHHETIMSLLCDFRSYTYGLPTVRGLMISVGIQGSVSIRIPNNRYDDILKSLEQSSPHALSFGIMNVDRQIHTKHLVTIENSSEQQYETRMISSANSTNQQINIGASFLVVNASLRSRDSPSSSPLDTSGSGSFSSNNNLNAKVNTIEDGIMLQIDSDTLKILKQCLKEKKDYSILAKARAMTVGESNDSVKKTSSEQLVEFLWVDDDNDINRGVRSPIDSFPMDGIRNTRIHYAGQRSSIHRLRWTDLFFIQCYVNNNESLDPTRLADLLAKGFTQALTPFLDMLIEGKCRKIGLRVTIDRENASYIAGSNGEQLLPFFLSQLDDHMIPIVMKASDHSSPTAPPLVLELIFYVLD